MSRTLPPITTNRALWRCARCSERGGVARNASSVSLWGQPPVQGQTCTRGGATPRARVNATPYRANAALPADPSWSLEDGHMQLWRRDRDRDASFVSNRASSQDEE